MIVTGFSLSLILIGNKYKSLSLASQTEKEIIKKSDHLVRKNNH